MRFILLHLGQIGHSLFFRQTLRVDIGRDKSSRINTSFSSHWFAHTTSPSSHPEVLPPCWPPSVTCGRRSFIYLHIVPIHFTDRRHWHCTVRAALRGLMMSCFKKRIIIFELYLFDCWSFTYFVYFESMDNAVNICKIEQLLGKAWNQTWVKT